MGAPIRIRQAAALALRRAAPGLPIGLTTRETGTLAAFVVSVGRLEREGA